MYFIYTIMYFNEAYILHKNTTLFVYIKLSKIHMNISNFFIFVFFDIIKRLHLNDSKK